MVNGDGKSTRELLEQLERMKRKKEVEAEVERRLAEERERERAAREQEAERRMLGTRRSQLTPKQKSEIIRSRGKPFYDALPW
jgi:hypothetical protein